MTTAGNLVYKLTADLTGLDQGLTNAERKALASGKTVARTFSAAVNGHTINIDGSISHAFDRAESTARSRGGRLNSVITGIFQGIGQSIAGTLTSAISGAVNASINGIKALAETTYRVGSSAEQLKISFTTIIGDAQKANKLLADMQRFSSSTPFTSQQVQQASQSLLTVVKPEEMITTLRRLGDVASGVNKPLSELTTIYQQVLSKGKLQAEEMLQFAERGIPIQKAVADVLGVQSTQVAELGSKGKITADIMVKAFALMADKGGQFNGIMAKQSQTLGGLASTMQDNFEQAANKLYQRINPALVQMLNSLGQAGEAAGKNSTILQTVGEISDRIAGFLKTHQEYINQAAIALQNMISGGLKEAASLAQETYNWFKQNPEVLDAAGQSLRVMGDGIKIVYNVAKALAPAFGFVLKVLSEISMVFNGIIEKIQGLINKSLEWAQSLAPVIESIGQIAGGAASTIAESTGSGTQGTVGEYGAYTIYNSNGSTVSKYRDLRAHHDYQSRNGNEVRDMVLARNGSQSVPVPSPISGRVTVAGQAGGYGNAVYVQGSNGEKAILGHMASLAVKVGQEIRRGQSVGIQGSTGKSTGVHLHIETSPESMKRYVDSLVSGNWGADANTGFSGGVMAGVNNIVNAGFRSTGSAARSIQPSSGWAKTKASFYGVGDGFQGGPTSSGEKFDTNKMTAAINERVKREQGLKLGDYVQVTANGRSVTVKLNDHGPYERQNGKFVPHSTRGLDLSGAAAKALGITDQGVADVQFRKVSPNGSPVAPLASRGSGRSQPDGDIPLASINRGAGKIAIDPAEVKRKAEERAKLVAQAEKAVAESQLAKLQAIADASSDDKLKASVDIRRIQLELEQKLKDVQQSGFDPKQRSLISQNLQGEATAKIQGVKQRLAETLKEAAKNEAAEMQRQAEERKRTAEDEARKARERAEALLSSTYSLSQGEIDLIRQTAEVYGDNDKKLEAAYRQIDLDTRKALSDLEREARDNSLPASQVQARRRGILSSADLRFKAADQDYASSEYSKLQESQTQNAEKGKRIQAAIEQATKQRQELAEAARQAEYNRRDSMVTQQTTIGSSNLNALQSLAGATKDPDKARALNIEAGQLQIRLDLTNQLQQIEQLGRSGEYTSSQLDKMRENAEAIANIKMDGLNDQFKTLGQTITDNVKSAFGDFLVSVLTGSQSVGDSLRNMINSVLNTVAQMGVNRLLGGIFGFADGGPVEAHASGGLAGKGRKFNSIGAAMRYERSASGRKPILATLHEGEMVIPASKVAEFGLNSINSFAMGNVNGSFSSGGTTVNIGDIVIPNNGSMNDRDADQLQKLVKNAVYGVITQEKRQGGILSR